MLMIQQSRLLHYHPKLKKHVNFFFLDHDKVLFMAIYNPTAEPNTEKAVQHSDYGGCENTTIHKYNKSCFDLCTFFTQKYEED